MARRSTDPRRTLLALALALLAAGCQVEAPDAVGRFCDATTPCGPGTHCNPKTSRCDAVGADTGPGVDLPSPDQRPPDTRPADLPPSPDAGCPGTRTWCGKCVDLKTDKAHCGACNSACSGPSDRCVAGKCACGTASAPCAAGLDCVSGACKCVKGGQCTGCCASSATCLAPGSSQSTTQCGVGGAACKSCSQPSKGCTKGACSASGKCQQVPATNGTKCDDKLSCTHNDKCLMGTCKGSSYSCDDKLSCTKDTCTGSGPPSGCSHSINSGYCAIALPGSKIKQCHANGGYQTSAKCRRCDSTKSSTSWTMVSNRACVTTVAGTGVAGLVNGSYNTARFYEPFGLAVGPNGKLYVADSRNHVIRVISGSQVSTFAGTGKAGLTNGAALSATFNYPRDVAVDSSGKVYVADTSNNAIRVISNGVVSTLAGGGASGYTEGSASSAKFYGPYGLDVASNGAVYIADTYNNRIRRIYNGVTYLVAGDGGQGLYNGSTSQARFYYPRDVAVTSGGVIYVAGGNNHVIRKISGSTVTTFAGTGSGGYANGQASTAKLYYPYGVALFSSSRLYVADRSNQRIRMITTGVNPQASLIAGSGSTGYLDGPAVSARFSQPYGLAVYRTSPLFGTVYIYVADTANHRIRRITLSSSGTL